MVFAPRNASVIEFPLLPNSNRCFGYMAMALGLDYWVVPELWSFYHLRYDATAERVAAAVGTLKHVITVRGLCHLLAEGCPASQQPEAASVVAASNPTPRLLQVLVIDSIAAGVHRMQPIRELQPQHAQLIDRLWAM